MLMCVAESEKSKGLFPTGIYNTFNLIFFLMSSSKNNFRQGGLGVGN